MTAPEPPRNVFVRHADGTTTPLGELTYAGKEPREVNGEIYIIEKWEVATVVPFSRGDKLDADFMPDNCIIGMRRVGFR